jgi:uncharacterized membrane-anchored protein
MAAFCFGALRQSLVREIERFHDPDFAESWRAAIRGTQERLSEITREILARHATEESALLERLEALRAEANALQADVDARGKRIRPGCSLQQRRDIYCAERP